MILANLYPLKTVILGSLFALGLVLLMPSTSNASASHELFKGPNGISVSGGHVWVTNVATLNKGGDWITELKASNGSLVRIINASADEFSNVGEIAVSGGHVWVTNSGTPSISDFGTPSTVDSVIELNASNGSLVRVINPQGNGNFDNAGGITVSGGHVWVTNQKDDAVTELNASNGSFVRAIK